MSDRRLSDVGQQLPFAPLADDECPWCGEVDCDESCATALLQGPSEEVPLGPAGRQALGGRP